MAINKMMRAQQVAAVVHWRQDWEIETEKARIGGLNEKSDFSRIKCTYFSFIHIRFILVIRPCHLLCVLPLALLGGL